MKRGTSQKPHSSDKERPLRLDGRLALRIQEVADVLGVSERHVRELLPQLPHCRLGSVVVVPVDLLREYLRDQAQVEASKVDSVVDEVLGDLKE